MKATTILKISLILLFVSVIHLSASAQYFEWAKRAGWYAFDLGYGTCTDNAGNVYIAGKYELNASFGNVRVGCAGNHDIYVAKYNSAGAFQWVRTAGGSVGDYAHAVACDGAGNVYLTGEFETTTRFGSSVTMSSSGNNDIFLAKYNTNGDLLYAKKFGGGGGNDRGLGISLFGDGVYITGRFQSTAYFSGVPLTTSGGTDMFVAKCNSASGALQWIKKAGSSGEDEGVAISNDPSGNVYVTGHFSSNCNFSGTPLSSSGATDIFVAKYTSAGALLWVRKAGGGASDYGMGIMADNAGRVFVTGGFRGNSNFSGVPLNGQGGNADIFVACYNSSGGVNWVRKAGGSQNDYGRAIDIDGSSNVYITGNFGNTATFGNKTISGADATEVYVASYDAAGNVRWVLRAGGEVDEPDPDRFIEMGLSISVDPYRNVYCSGTYRSVSTFGSTALSPWDHTDVYLAKINQSGAAKMARTEGFRAVVSPVDSVAICPGTQVQLKVNQDSGSVYKWMKDGVFISGADKPEYNASGEGAFAVTKILKEDTIVSEPVYVMVAENIPGRNCFAESQQSMVENDSLLMKVYPNPNSGMFTIEVKFVNSEETNDKVTVEVLSATGQLVYQRISSYTKGIFKEQIELDSKVPVGIYFLQVTIGSKTEKTKMMLLK